MSSTTSTEAPRGLQDVLSGGSKVNSSSDDIASITHEQLESSYVEEEDDPLGVKKLALSFDYLMYKISEKMEALSRQTEASVVSRKDEADKELVEIEESMNNLKELIKKCEDLDNDFTRIEQISVIVTDFKQRIKALEANAKRDLST